MPDELKNVLFLTKIYKLNACVGGDDREAHEHRARTDNNPKRNDTVHAHINLRHLFAFVLCVSNLIKFSISVLENVRGCGKATAPTHNCRNPIVCV